MQIQHTSCLLFALGVAALGCSTSAEEPAERGRASSENHALATTPSSPTLVQGFAADAKTTAFHFGQVLREFDQDGIHRIVGKHGVVAIHNATKGLLAVPNADSPSRTKGPLFRSGDEHNAYTKAYFISRGLPADQIGEVRTHTTMVNEGSLAELGNASRPDKAVLLRFTTVVKRQIDGIVVDDSYAWASFDADQEATAEEIYWPAIPKETVAEAKRMKAQKDSLASTARRSLTNDVTGTSVSIRHGAWRDENVAAIASLELTTKAGATSNIVHINARGESFQLPSELVRPELSATPDTKAGR